jgi:hypothetical protein
MLYKNAKRKMTTGGSIDPGSYMMAGQITGSLVEGAPDEYGIKKNAVGGGALKGAGGGAALGATIGLNPAVMTATGGLSAIVAPIAGALIGGAAGGIKSSNEQKAARSSMAKDKAKQFALSKEAEANRTKAFWTNNPNFKDGTLASSYFRYGGTAKINPSAASEGVEFKGPSHEQGGIDLGGGVEVEGNETMDKGFVFSDKLGFAAKHKKMMSALDKMDKKPANPATARSAAAIKDKIEGLKVEQETTKSLIGLPNDMDGTSGNVLTKQFALGGRAYPEIDEDQLALEKQQAIDGVNYVQNEKLASGRLAGMRSITTPGSNQLYDNLAKLNTEVKQNMPSIVMPKITSAGTGVTPPVVPTAETATPSNFGSNLKSGLETVTPYLSNLYAAKQIKKLKEPPAPVTQAPIAAAEVDYEGAVQEVRNQARAGRQLSERYLSSGAAVAATTASSGIEATKAITDIQKEEQNANSGIRTQAASVNAEIEARNNALINGYNENKVSFANAKASANMENISNATEKLLTQMKDAKSYDVDKMRLQMSVLSDMEGVSWRNLEPVIAKIAKPGSKEYNAMKGIYEERQANAKKTRGENLDYQIAEKEKVTPTEIATTTTPSTAAAQTSTQGAAASGSAKKTSAKPAATSGTLKNGMKAAAASKTTKPVVGAQVAVKATGDIKEVNEIKRRLSPELAIMSTPAEKAKLKARLKELSAVEKAETDRILKINLNRGISR